MLRAILNKSWRQHPTRHQLYAHLPPITKTIQVRRTRHAGHCWRSKDELISDVLLWIPAYGQAKAGTPTRTYIQQVCEDTGCSPEDLPEAMNDTIYHPSARAGYDTRSIFKRSLTGLNSEFSFSYTSCLTKAEEPSLSYYLPIAGGRIIGFIPFPRVLVLREMQSVSSRIWTRMAVFFSYGDNDYTTGTSIKRWMMGRSCERGLGISVLAARHDDDDDDEAILTFYTELWLNMKNNFF